VSLSSIELAQLKKLVAIAEKLIANAEPPKRGRPKSAANAPAPRRTRRSGKDLAAFRKMLKSERKKGVPVADLARSHGISAAYIYQLK
jgi:hypothetical protein